MSNSSELKKCRKKLENCEKREHEGTGKVLKVTLDFVFAQREYARYTRNVLRDTYNRNLPSGMKTINAQNFMKAEFDHGRMRWAFGQHGIDFSYAEDIIRAVRDGDKIAHKFDHVRDFKNLENLERDMNAVLVSNEQKESFKRISHLWRTTISKIVASDKIKKKEKENAKIKQKK